MKAFRIMYDFQFLGRFTSTGSGRHLRDYDGSIAPVTLIQPIQLQQLPIQLSNGQSNGDLSQQLSNGQSNGGQQQQQSNGQSNGGQQQSNGQSNGGQQQSNGQSNGGQQQSNDGELGGHSTAEPNLQPDELFDI